MAIKFSIITKRFKHFLYKTFEKQLINQRVYLNYFHLILWKNLLCIFIFFKHHDFFIFLYCKSLKFELPSYIQIYCERKWMTQKVTSYSRILSVKNMLWKVPISIQVKMITDRQFVRENNFSGKRWNNLFKFNSK